jgi:hypothetical protein
MLILVRGLAVGAWHGRSMHMRMRMRLIRCCYHLMLAIRWPNSSGTIFIRVNVWLSLQLIILHHAWINHQYASFAKGRINDVCAHTHTHTYAQANGAWCRSKRILPAIKSYCVRCDRAARGAE